MNSFHKKDDELWFLLFPWGFKIWKYIKWYMMIFAMLWEAVFVFFMKEDLYYFKKYSSNFLAAQTVILFNVINMFIFHEENCLKMLNWMEKYGLPWTAVGQKTHEILFHDNKKFKLMMVLVIFGATTVHLIFLPYPDICQPFHKLFEEHFPSWMYISDSIILVLLLVAGYGSGCFLWKISYLVRHATIQCYILNVLLQNISGDEAEYLTTHQKLVQFVKMHQRTKKLFGLIVKHFQWMVHPVYISTCLALVSAIHSYIFGLSSTGGLLSTRALITHSNFGLVAFVVINGGQQLSNESEKISHYAYHCNWYKWNRNSKQLILMILANSSKPMTISSYGLVFLDNSITGKIAKICWSVMAVLRRINEKYN